MSSSFDTTITPITSITLQWFMDRRKKQTSLAGLGQGNLPPRFPTQMLLSISSITNATLALKVIPAPRLGTSPHFHVLHQTAVKLVSSLVLEGVRFCGLTFVFRVLYQRKCLASHSHRSKRNIVTARRVDTAGTPTVTSTPGDDSAWSTCHNTVA